MKWINYFSVLSQNHFILYFYFKTVFLNPIFYYHWSFSPRSEGLLLLSLLLLLSKYLIHLLIIATSVNTIKLSIHYTCDYFLIIWKKGSYSNLLLWMKQFRGWSYSLYNIDSIRTTEVLINNAKRSLDNALTTGQRQVIPPPLRRTTESWQPL